jgi:L-ascorbate metabolism protein UlaG (beta-lactamase superfamily)
MSAATCFPISDHCDGVRFFNPAGLPTARPFTDLPKWWWQRLVLGQGERWPKNLPAPKKPVLPTSVAAGQVAATWIGHATWLLQFSGFTVLTDPVFAHRAGPWGVLGPPRARSAALTLPELPKVDLVLLSHNHYDHLDLAALRVIARRDRPLVVAPLGLKAWLEARGVTPVVELDWWQAHEMGGGATVTCTPAQHWSSRWPWDRCRTLWGGFMLRTAAGAVYFAGDTGWAPHFAVIREKLGAPDLALLPIGAYEPRWFMESVHMNPDEAVRAHRALGARQSLGMHHRTWQLTDEAYEAPGRDLAAARQPHGVGAEAFAAPEIGETVRVALA